MSANTGVLGTRSALLRWPRYHPRRRIFLSWLRAASSVASSTPLEAKGTAEPKILNARKRRASKFTAERLEQIRNLVALGKSREEIAGLLGVTVGTLQVTCSKRGISLRRRPKFSSELNLPAHEIPPRPNDIEPQQAAAANLALTMHLRGRQRTLPLRAFPMK
jgi:hypothetical protein